VWVIGGLDTAGNPVIHTASAPILPTGQLGAFSETAIGNLQAGGTAYHEVFGVGTFLYTVGGVSGSQTNPYAFGGTSTPSCYYGQVMQGGFLVPWLATKSLNKGRQKFTLFQTFGKVLVFEGDYGTPAPTTEGEDTSIN